jgi:hypothetical protein
MQEPKVLSSVLVTDGYRIGEIWTMDESPYPHHNNAQAAYVVFRNGSADWLRLEDLRPIGEAVTLSATA